MSRYLRLVLLATVIPVAALMAIPSWGATFTVNSQGNIPDTNLADGICNVRMSGAPSCTLRAAIESANETAEQDTIVFDYDAFPYYNIRQLLTPISNPLIISAGPWDDSDTSRVTLDGEHISSTQTALQIDSSGVELEGLALVNYSGSPLSIGAGGRVTARGIQLKDNCGWGATVDGGALLLYALNQQWSLVENNGSGSGCSAGGLLLLQAQSSLSVEGATIADNAGPGILGQGELVAVGQATISGNQGAGVAIVRGTSGIIDTERFVVDPTILENSQPVTIQDNRGQGIFVQTGEIRISAPIKVLGNGGWGIYARGVARIGDIDSALAERSQISNNGHASSCPVWSIENGVPEVEHKPCRGGGIVSTYDGGSNVNQLVNANVNDNNGPGFLAAVHIVLMLANINNNAGQGVAVERDDGTVVLDDKTIEFLEYGSADSTTISNNQGHGLHAEYGKVSVAATITIAGNSGWGILADNGAVEIGLETESLQTQTIRDNGAGQDCYTWSIDDGKPAVRSEDCPGGGVLVDDGDCSGQSIFVVENKGPGIEVNNGDLVLVDSEVCNNRGTDISSSGGKDLTGMTQCDKTGDSDKPEEPGCQGCSGTGGPSSAGLLLLWIFLFGLGRRHTQRKLC